MNLKGDETQLNVEEKLVSYQYISFSIIFVHEMSGRILGDLEKVREEMLRHAGVLGVFAFSALDTALESSSKMTDLAREMVKTWIETAQSYAPQKPSQ